MRYIIYLIHTCCIVFLCIFSAYSQKKDFQTRNSFAIDKEITDDFDLQGEYEVRLDKNSTHFDEHLIELEGQYDGFDWFDIDLGYRFTMNNELHFTEKLHRMNLDMAKEIEIDVIDTDIDYRVRFTSEYTTSETHSYENPETYFRNKITATYRINDWEPDPYFAFEYYIPLYQKPFPVVDQDRYEVGTEFELIDDLDMEISYRFQRGFDDIPEYDYILTFGLTYGF